jgi:tetratricopeptide (TPR) repeat protein
LRIHHIILSLILLGLALPLWAQQTQQIQIQLVPNNGQPPPNVPRKQSPQSKPPAQVEEQLIADRARRAEMAGDYDRALQMWREVMNRSAWNAEAVNAIPRILIVQRQYDAADSFLVSLLEKSQFRQDGMLRPSDPTSPFSIELNRGTVTLARGDREGAWKQWTAAIQKVGRNPETMRAFVTILQQNRMWEESEQQIRDYRKSASDNAFMALELANSLRGQMNFAAATDELLLYADAQPSSWQVPLNYLQQFPDDSTVQQKVMATLKKAVQHDRKNATYWKLYAGYALKAGDLPTSLDATIAADSLSQSGGQLLLVNAQTLLDEGDVAAARKGFQRIIDWKVQPDIAAKAELGLGRCLEALGKWSEAKTAYETFIRNHQTFREVDEARFRIADLLLQHERKPGEALTLFTGLWGRAPGAARAPIGLKMGDCHARMQEYEPAIAAWGDVVQIGGGVVTEDGAQALLRMARANFWRDSLSLSFKCVDSVTNGNVGNTAFNDAVRLTALLEEGGVYRAQRAFAEADYATFTNQDSLAAARYAEAVQLMKSGKLAEYCLLQEANALRRAGAFTAAVAVLDTFVLNYAESVDLDQAAYTRALIKMEDLKDLGGAKQEFEQFLVDHPRSLYLEQARRKARILANRVS